MPLKMSTLKGNAIANMLAQLVSFAGFLELARIYGPGRIGVFATVNGACWILAVIATLQIEHLLTIPRKFSGALTLASLSLIIAAILPSIIIIGVFSVASLIAYNSPIVELMSKSVFITIITVFFISLHNLVKGLFVRTGSITLITLLSCSTSILTILYAIVFAGLNFWNGILMAQITAYASSIAILLLVKKPFRNFTSLFFRAISMKRYFYYCRIYKSQVLDLLSSNLAKTISSRSLYMILSLFYPSSTIGMISISERIASAPTIAASSVISASFRYSLAEEKRKLDKPNTMNQLYKIYYARMLKSYSRMLPITLSSLIILYFAFSRINQETDWKSSIYFIGIFIPVEFFRFAYGSVEDAGAIANLTRYRVFWEYSLLVAQLATLAASTVHRANIYVCLAFVMALRIIWYCIDLMYIRYLSISGNES